MTPGGTRKALLIALCSAALGAVTMATSCTGPMIHAYDHYPLARCPDSAFVLPDTVDRTPWLYVPDAGLRSSGEARPRAWCRGFRALELDPIASREDDPAPRQIEARLIRGRSCAVDVGFAYQRPFKASYRSAAERAEYAAIVARTDSAANQFSRRLARRLMESSGVELADSPTSSKRTTNWRELNGWCHSVLPSTSTDSAQR